jgi:hypothetical protein
MFFLFWRTNIMDIDEGNASSSSSSSSSSTTTVPVIDWTYVFDYMLNDAILRVQPLTQLDRVAERAIANVREDDKDGDATMTDSQGDEKTQGGSARLYVLTYVFPSPTVTPDTDWVIKNVPFRQKRVQVFPTRLVLQNPEHPARKLIRWTDAEWEALRTAAGVPVLLVAGNLCDPVPHCLHVLRHHPAKENMTKEEFTSQLKTLSDRTTAAFKRAITICQHCGQAPSSLRFCSRCACVMYCDAEHERAHRAEHADRCDRGAAVMAPWLQLRFLAHLMLHPDAPTSRRLPVIRFRTE